MKNFFKRHWWKILIAIIVIVLVIVIVALIKNNKKNSGITGIVKFDGQKISVFESANEAIDNSFQTDAGEKPVSVKHGDKNTKVTAKINNFKTKIVTDNGKGDFVVDLSQVADQEIVLFEVKNGGDDSWFGDRIGNEVKRYYFAVLVKNDSGNNSGNDSGNDSGNTNPSQTTQGVSCGEIEIGGEKFDTYPSEADALSSINNITTEIAENFTIKSINPSSKTKRIVVKICYTDKENTSEFNLPNIVLSSENDWTNSLDVSSLSGSRIALMITSEDAFALNNTFSYIAFYIP